MLNINNKVYKRNEVAVNGILEEDIVLDHIYYGEKIYTSKINIKRRSEVLDTIPIRIPGRIINEDLIESMGIKNKRVELIGELRSNTTNGKLKLYIFAKEINFIEHNDSREERNFIYLDGYVCKPVIYRKTPLGKDIADVLIAVNREKSKKSDYIPCIVWGEDAKLSENIMVGERISLNGRIQSREYEKQCYKKGSLIKEKRIAYEVSIRDIINEEKILQD